MIRHTVLFRLRHDAGSEAEAAFLENALALANIPGVTNFAQLRVLDAEDFDYAFSMDFADQVAYDGYNGHPDHTAFVADRWVPEVAAFREIDYTPLG
ncbi:hypothetical protein HDC94_000260 [Leifsonia sp. AK011]|uniref:Dabb family protein n=1 Tax=Leifsonia sp. AK011 TaxID=2723075 RepID=UPI0015C7D151|nr:Dabb family protein [Leifsonia sp. AK011]NYF09104.1 hypothetical protein [Leifsonia sp. AK011]